MPKHEETMRVLATVCPLGLLLAIVSLSCARHEPVSAQNDRLYEITVSNRVGFIDSKGFVTIAPQFDVSQRTSHAFSEGLCAVALDGKTGFIATNGHWAIQPQFETCSSFTGGHAVVKQNEKYGVINRDGAFSIPPTYDAIDSFAEGYFTARAGKSVYVLDPTGGVRFSLVAAAVTNKPEARTAPVLPPGLAHVTNIVYLDVPPYTIKPFSEGKAIVQCDFSDRKYCGIISLSGFDVKYVDYKYVEPYENGYAVYITQGKCGYLNAAGEVAVSNLYLNAEPFREGKAAVRPVEGDIWVFDPFWQRQRRELKGGKWGYIDPKGDTVIPFAYDFCRSFSGGLAAVCVSNKFGFIDHSGTFVITPQYDEVRDFCEGVAAVGVEVGTRTNNNFVTPIHKWGYVNSKGNIVITPQFRTASDFQGGLARVNTGYINREGALVWADPDPE